MAKQIAGKPKKENAAERRERRQTNRKAHTQVTLVFAITGAVFVLVCIVVLWLSTRPKLDTVTISKTVPTPDSP